MFQTARSLRALSWRGDLNFFTLKIVAGVGNGIMTPLPTPATMKCIHPEIAMKSHPLSSVFLWASLGLAMSGAQAFAASNTSAGSKKAIAKKSMPSAAAQQNPAATPQGGGKDEKKDAVDAPPMPGDGQTPWQPLPQKLFSRERRAAECSKYEGKYISSYDNLYRVEKCRRRLITNGDLTRKVTLTHPVYPVKNDTIIMLAEGTPIESLTEIELSATALCRRLEGDYITIPGGDIYVVEDCKRRMFPDWETFTEHQKKTKKLIITEISAPEMDSLKVGKEIPSIMPAIFKKLLTGSAQVDVIPLNEACRGVNGKLVFYYTHIYKIENCRKREVDAEEYMKRHKYERFKLPELTSEQWLSLPDGKAMAINDVEAPPPFLEPSTKDSEKESPSADEEP